MSPARFLCASISTAALRRAIRARRRGNRPRVGFQPRLEGIEDRQLLSTTINPFPLAPGVTATSDPVVGWDGNLYFTESRSPDQAKTFIVQVTPTGQVVETPIPSGRAALGDLTVGPDGNLWFTEQGDIASYNPTASGSASLTEFPVGSPGDTPTSLSTSLTVGDDGNLWFIADTRDGANDHITVDQITTDGTITPFPADGLSANETLMSEPDGNLWAAGSGILAKITTDGVVTPVPLPDNGSPLSITADWNGNLWVPYLGSTTGVQLAEVTTDGTVTNIPLPNVKLLTVGGDGNIWFTQSLPGGGTAIGSIATDGTNTITMLPTTLSGNVDTAGTLGGDGNLYFVEDATPSQAAAVVEVAQDGSGTVTQIPIAQDTSTSSGTTGALHGLTSTDDGNLWFIDQQSGSITQVNLNLPPPPVVTPILDGTGPIAFLPGGFSNGVTIPGSASKGRTAPPAPAVESVVRSGVRYDPTVLTLTLNVALNPAQAKNVDNYSLVLVGPRGRSRPHAKPIVIKSAVYNATTHTVTLLPAHRLPLRDYFRLTVNGASGSGIRGVTGTKLGASNPTAAGSNFVALLHEFGTVAPITAHTKKHTKHATAKGLSKKLR